MRKSIVSQIAACLFFAPNGAPAGAAPQEVPANVSAEGPKEAEKAEPQGKIGKVDAEAEAEAARVQQLINELHEKRNAIVVPENHESEEYKSLLSEMSNAAKIAGDGIKDSKKKSAEVWPFFEALHPMTVNAEGKMEVAKFLNAAWDAMLPEVKLVNPLAKKVGAFFGWNEARIRGNSAAQTIENVRNYIRNNGPRLYPQFHKPAPEASEAEKKAAENVATFTKAKKAVDGVLGLTYLPATRFVELDENDQPKEGAKPLTLAEILKAFEAEAIAPHIPAKLSEKEKAAIAAKEQTEAELEAERKAIEEEKAALKAEREEFEAAQKEAEKERKRLLLEAKRGEGKAEKKK